MSDAAAPRFSADPGLAAVCDAVLDTVGSLGPYEVRPHKSGLHVLRPDGVGVCVIAAEPDALLVTLALPDRRDSPRLLTAVRVSSRVWNQRLRLERDAPVDAELRGWLADAYRR